MKQFVASEMRRSLRFGHRHHGKIISCQSKVEGSREDKWNIEEMSSTTSRRE